MANIPALPTYPEPFWMKSAESLPSYPKLEENIETDVVVVGGGISGITTGYLLAKAGLRVVLLEASTLFSGTTGHTTAKITAQHDIIYDALIKQQGYEKAELYYKANADALQFIRDTVNEHGIECGFTEQDAYVYTNTDSYLSKLQDEMAAYERLGITGYYVDHIPLTNIPAIAAVVMKKQAQFHPLQYLSALAGKFVEAGGRIYEHSTATDIQQDQHPVVSTANGYQITCDRVVICSHFPFFDGYGFFFARMHAERSYALAVKSKVNYPGGMYLSAEEPKRSIRSATDLDGSPLLIIGGQNHKTGQGICTINHYETLQRFAAENFGTESISYRWSAQDLVTGDKLPYVGRITENNPNIFIASGFKKWGMTTGTAAALLIRDLVQEHDNPYTQLFAPSRSLSLSTLKNLVVDNLDVAKHLVSGKVEMVHRKPHELNSDEGAVVSVHGRRAGAYRDTEGKLHVVDTTCTHMGCEVEWNDGERTWDCPCHGSRFSITGTVLEGPAERPLKTIEVSS
ncbi:FAD-dependent oxidoreductase [Paenibacillus sp. Leaf72]|uniref:FAD-dependent oxidoreductase n=1 Tax=Paenibacillus sp. Leaf72 TaxID=1736234 RepID=UPI0006F9888E|nr:FAD-dependent oxidoreductase [Paenibacillus sp. Leaf72]KQN99904.1 (2Fe-2S)-binding protein [Paenibacillus sp. Leaf72]